MKTVGQNSVEINKASTKRPRSVQIDRSYNQENCRRSTDAIDVATERDRRLHRPLLHKQKSLFSRTRGIDARPNDLDAIPIATLIKY
ncbi:hypothetical protein BCAR13_440079 [Paraburkholderia caribensis]|nr:hypothetical protein BCAR13_440079 [Paraburkholderia caribensis]